jgi:hypothetical protein
MYVSFSPKIDLRTRKGKAVSSTYLRLLHTQVKFEDGGIMYESGFNESLKFFRKAFSFFNIIGIPFEIPARNYMIGIVEKKSQTLRMVISEKAKRYGSDTKPIELSVDDLRKIEVTLNEIKTKYDENLSKLGTVYEFLGYSRYYFFNEDYLLSFINGFIFLEAILSNMWANLVKKEFARIGSPPTNERDWVLSIKIDVLYIEKALGREDREVLHYLRKKRNGVFHADTAQTKRNITETDAERCVKICLKLFYRSIHIEQDFDFKETREKIYTVLHRPSWIDE